MRSWPTSRHMQARFHGQYRHADRVVGSLSFIFRKKSGLKKLPNWVWSLGWVAFALALFEILGPLVDWISAYPGYFVLIVGA